MKLLKFSFILIVALSSSSLAADNEKLEELLSAVDDVESETIILSPTCELEPLERLIDEKKHLTLAQYIYNGVYEWSYIERLDGVCVYVRYPIRQLLTLSEATKFLNATKHDFPVENVDEPIERSPNTENAEDPDFYIEIDADGSIRRNKDNNRSTPGMSGGSISYFPAPSPLHSANLFWSNSDFPYNSVTLVTKHRDFRFSASAVQLSPYVYATAAHALYKRSTNLPISGLKVWPGHNVPNGHNAVSKSVTDSVYHPDWPNVSEAESFSRDIGFLRVASPRHLSRYPAVVLFNSVVDSGACNISYDQWRYYNIGNQLRDPYYIPQALATPHCSKSWYNLGYFPTPQNQYLDNQYTPGCYHQNYYIHSYSQKFTVGYPALYNGIPWLHEGDFKGHPNDETLDCRFLYHLNSSSPNPATPFIGIFAESFPGQSGGAIFGTLTGKRGELLAPLWNHHFLLGIITNAVTSHQQGDVPFTFASGRFNYNNSFWLTNMAWTP